MKLEPMSEKERRVLAGPPASLQLLLALLTVLAIASWWLP